MQVTFINPERDYFGDDVAEPAEVISFFNDPGKTVSEISYILRTEFTDTSADVFVYGKQCSTEPNSLTNIAKFTDQVV